MGAIPCGSLIGHPVENICVVLTDGASHAVGSSELAFKLAAIYAFRQERKAMIAGNDQDNDDSVITAHVPLNTTFGYSTTLRSMTQGKGEFTMEYVEHLPVAQDVQTQLINTYKALKGAS